MPEIEEVCAEDIARKELGLKGIGEYATVRKGDTIVCIHPRDILIFGEEYTVLDTYTDCGAMFVRPDKGGSGAYYASARFMKGGYQLGEMPSGLR